MRLRPGITNNYLNWKQVIDHVAGVVLVMLVRLNLAIGIFCAGQQCVLTRLLRRNPIKFPTSPRMPLNHYRLRMVAETYSTLGSDILTCAGIKLQPTWRKISRRL